MTTVNIYLNFNGNCEEAFNFYKFVFNREFSCLGRFNEMAVSDELTPMPSEMQNMIMHVALPISNHTCLMGSDTGGVWAPSFQQGNNFSVAVNTNSKEDADRIFNLLSARGIITMPIGKTFWSEYNGMCTDKFGINWMVSIDMTKA